MRLDVFLAENGLALSRTEARGFIEAGAVYVDGKPILKPAYCIDGLEEKVILDRSVKKYVSRGGIKLDGALCTFKVDVKDRLCLDVGASSGGFTDCLLQHGARAVCAVDSGSGQLVASIRNDPRVLSKESFNARYMVPEDFPYVPNLAVMDVSFISATLIFEALSRVLAPDSDFICLVKPQFEVGREHLGKGGIVKDEKARKAALDKVVSAAKEYGFGALGAMTSPIKGGDGNVEYLVHFKKTPV